MHPDESKIQEGTAEIAPEISGLSEETIAKLSEIRKRLESHVNKFNGREMWYQERSFQFQGIPHITTDAWGIRIRFESENFRTLSLSGRWDMLISYSDSLGAMYCGWHLAVECPWPELGTSFG